MKISIDFDVTPEEARHFLGLPDIASMQETLVKEMTDRMQASLASMNPETLWQQWMPVSGSESVDAMRQFWEQVTQGGFASGAAKDPKS